MNNLLAQLSYMISFLFVLRGRTISIFSKQSQLGYDILNFINFRHSLFEKPRFPVFSEQKRWSLSWNEFELNFFVLNFTINGIFFIFYLHILRRNQKLTLVAYIKNNFCNFYYYAEKPFFCNSVYLLEMKNKSFTLKINGAW